MGKKKTVKAKIIRDEEREKKMSKLFSLWNQGSQEAYEQLLQIARQEDQELTEGDFVHPFATDQFAAEEILHIASMGPIPDYCILENGLSLEELKDWKELFLKQYAFYPPTEYLALLHFCNGCEFEGKQILGFGVKPSYLNVMKERSQSNIPWIIKSYVVLLAKRCAGDRIFYYIYYPAEKIYVICGYSRGEPFDSEWQVYGSLWEALLDMKNA